MDAYLLYMDTCLYSLFLFSYDLNNLAIKTHDLTWRMNGNFQKCFSLKLRKSYRESGNATIKKSRYKLTKLIIFDTFLMLVSSCPIRQKTRAGSLPLALVEDLYLFILQCLHVPGACKISHYVLLCYSLLRKHCFIPWQFLQLQASHSFASACSI